MGESDPTLRPEAMRVQRRELYRMSELSDRAFGIAKEGFGPSTRKQGRRKIRIERECPLYEGGSIIEVVRNKDERVPSTGQSNGIVRPQFDCAPAQSLRFSDLLGGVNNPAVYFAPEEAHRGQPVRRCKAGVELDGTVKQAQRFVVGFASPFVQTGQCAQEIVIGVKIFSLLAFGPFNLHLLEPGRDLADDLGSDTVLKIEDVLQRAVELVGPKMHSRGRIDHLPGDPHSVARFAHTPFEHITRTELASNLLHVHVLALVGEA